MFPPGRARLATRPLPTGSGSLVSMIGTVEVADIMLARDETPTPCLGFRLMVGEPDLRVAGYACGGAKPLDRPTLACALDRFTLLAAGSEPKVGALFANAELRRTFCGQRSPLRERFERVGSALERRDARGRGERASAAARA